MHGLAKIEMNASPEAVWSLISDVLLAIKAAVEP